MVTLTNSSREVSPLVEEYNPKVFDELPLFRDSKEALRTQRSRLCPVGGAIVHNGLGERLGVSLLHKHFPLAQDEILIRSFDMPNRTVTMRPSKEGKSHAIPYLWRLVRQTSGRFSYYPLEYVREEDAEDFSDFNLGDHADFLLDMAQTLTEHGVQDVFGVAVPTNIRKLAQDDEELLIETTDHATRTLTVTPHAGPLPENEELTETIWTFSAAEEASADEETVLGCTGTHCAGHCHGHCLSHCTGHCHGHHALPQ
jgi:hypothetical protein